MAKWIFIVLLTVTVTACGGPYRNSYLKEKYGITDFGGPLSPVAASSWRIPSYLAGVDEDFTAELPWGDTSYGNGVRDGCETVMSFGSGMVRIHDFAYDPMRGFSDPEYYKGFRTGFNYCTYRLDVDPL